MSRKHTGQASKELLQAENAPGEAMRVFPYHKIAARTRHKASELRRDVAERFVEAFRAGHGKAGMSGFVMSFLGFLYEECAGERRNAIHKWGGALVAVFSYSPKLLSYGEI